jgi:hypothetical protein
LLYTLAYSGVSHGVAFQNELDAILATARSSRAEPDDADTDLGEGNEIEDTTKAPQNWAGHWSTDMGLLRMVQIDREVHGQFEDSVNQSATAHSFLGVITTDPRTLVGEIALTAGQAGFKITLNNRGLFRGFWWWSDARDKVPWSGKRTLQLNQTSHFGGAVSVHGDMTATGVVKAAALGSSTLTSPSRQESLPYLLSALSCHWKRTQLDPSCGAAEDPDVSGSSWGGMANVKAVEVEEEALKIEFSTAYAGSPICFVSFGGKETTLDYSIDTNPDHAKIFLKKNGCCATAWKNFDGKFSLICHGATSQNL